MESAQSRAIASVGAPVTTTSIILVAPSPSVAIARASSPKRSVSAFSSTVRSGPGSEMRAFPASPFASARTQSFVDISPSTETMLRVFSTARPSASWSAFGVTAASVVTRHNVVASEGASIPEPLQSAEMIAVLPPSVTSRAAILRRVSVVMIASAARSGWSPSCSTRPGSAVTIFIAGRRAPMTPVEAVRTARFCTPRASATALRMTETSSSPAGPVSAFAFPELATMARIPSAGTRGRASCTGAAAARFTREEAGRRGGVVGHDEREVAARAA